MTHLQKIIPMFLGALLLSAGLHAATMNADLENLTCRASGLNSTGLFPLQGTACPENIGAGANFKKSTWVCPGTTTTNNMLKIQCSDGTHPKGFRECVYIDNYSNIDGKENSFFVPINTVKEWQSFRDQKPAGIDIRLGCESSIYTDRDKNAFSLPDMRVPLRTDTSALAGTISEVASAENKDCRADFQCTMPTTKTSDGRTIPIEAGCGIWSLISQTPACAQQAALTFNGNACRVVGKPTEFAIVLDASSSMDQLLGGAQNALRSLSKTYLEPRPDIPLTISVIGGDAYSDKLEDPSKANCPYGRAYGPAASNSADINRLVDPVFATGNTPIDTTLRYAADSFSDATKRRVMLVLTDGFETCYGDPAQAISELRNNGIEVYGIKYGISNDAVAMNVFNAMNRYAPANSQDEIIAAMETIVKDVVEKSCKPILRLYATGDTAGEPIYTLQAGSKIKVTRGTYDAVVDYCTGKQVFVDQKFDNDRSFDFNLECKK
jgi:hypothetical protein